MVTGHESFTPLMPVDRCFMPASEPRRPVDSAPHDLAPDDPAFEPSDAETARDPLDKLGADEHIESSSGPSQQIELFETQPPPWELNQGEDTATAQIVFSEAPHGPYDYEIPAEMRDQIEPGMRVRVPLGRRKKLLGGWCISTQFDAKSSPGLRPIAELVDDEPLCDASLVRLVLWMSHYYQAPAGAVFDALIPSSVRGDAGTRMRTYLHVNATACDEETLVSLTTKQQTVMRLAIAHKHPLTAADLMVRGECTEDPIRRLRKKGLLIPEQRRELTSSTSTLRWQAGDGEVGGEHDLTEEQRQALAKIDAAIDAETGSTLLLHGVTGSGKTEVYIQAIEHVVKFGRGAIVLGPEISLTPQTRGRFERRFDSVAVLHSQMTPAERHFQWRRIRSGEVQVVIGPRSAIFAPLPRLGLIVIDEEHDASFKQDTQPRYHARRVAHARAMSLKIPLILGSATPSLETWHASKNGHAELIRMTHRIENRAMPDVQLVDLRVRDDRTGGSISRPLHTAINETLAEKGQTILLLNRRGFATSIQCPSCGHVVACPDCDMPLTHHRDGGKAVCHFCDFTIPTPPWCPVCRFDGIRYSGLGTQRLEDEVKMRFPKASIARMDSDTMKRPGSHQRVLSAFRAGDVDILLGTQMIAKGLDFPNVLLVGVINADSALHFPDFRAAERTFQLVTQVAGRTGRGNRGGRVVVQTFSPEHPAIQAASHHDYTRFAEDEMVNREKFRYPPLGYVARIIFRGPSEELTDATAANFVSRLEAARLALGSEVRILGPAPPPFAKLRGKYRFHVLLQSPRPGPLGETIRRATANFVIPEKDDIQYVVDIDPVDML